jgi:hypothetical protein
MANKAKPKKEKKEKSVSGDSDDFEKARDVRQMADLVRWFIGGVVLLLGGIFSIAKLRGLPVIKVSSDDWSRFFVQVALVIYFWSWIFGSKSDLNAQESVTREMLVPKTRVYSLLAWCGTLVVVFMALWRIHTFAMFSLALIVFLGIDLVLGRYYYWRVLRPQFMSSRKQFMDKNNTLSALEVDIVDDYMNDRWRFWRHGFGFAWATVFLIADATGISQSIASFTGAFSPDSLLALSVLTLVLVLEMWMWAFRVKRQGQRLLLSHLRDRFGKQAKIEI